MTVAEILDELAMLGSEQTLTIYRRHGLEGDAFGVKYGDLEKLVRRLKSHSHFAPELWASGKHDARVLATKLADPATVTKRLLKQWVKEVNRISVADLSTLVSRTPHARGLAEEWTKVDPARHELTHITGWFVVAKLAVIDDSVETAWFENFLDRIGTEIKTAPNQTRYALNETLISIGGRNVVSLRNTALKIAKDIGKVEVDHGETGCKTPDAASYIEKVWERRKKVGGR